MEVAKTGFVPDSHVGHGRIKDGSQRFDLRVSRMEKPFAAREG